MRRHLFQIGFSISLFCIPLAFASADTSASIQSLFPASTILSGQAVTFSVLPVGFINPTYSIKDSFVGSSVSATSTDAYGNFSWTPTPTEGGAHTITITISDSRGGSATVVQTISVQAPIRITVTDLLPSTIVAAGNTLSFNINEIGLIDPTYTIVDSFNGTTLSKANIVASSSVRWIPAPSDIGPHTLTLFATDTNGRSATTPLAITVISAAPLATPPTQTVVISTTTPTATSAPSTHPHIFNSYLSLGSSGADVAALQTILIQKGYFTLSANGYFGPRTKAALKQFQHAHSLQQTGSVGAATRALLNKTGR